jgi:hypothetical protein
MQKNYIPCKHPQFACLLIQFLVLNCLKYIKLLVSKKNSKDYLSKLWVTSTSHFTGYILNNSHTCPRRSHNDCLTPSLPLELPHLLHVTRNLRVLHALRRQSTWTYLTILLLWRQMHFLKAGNFKKHCRSCWIQKEQSPQKQLKPRQLEVASFPVLLLFALMLEYSPEWSADPGHLPVLSLPKLQHSPKFHEREF